MKVHLLGTGGADGIPSFFARSEFSDKARQLAGKDIRTRSGAVVDETLKIDFGPDTFAQSAAQGVDPSRWTDILVTHSHFDHFDAGLLQYCLPPFVTEAEPVPAIHGNGEVRKLLRSAIGDLLPFKPLESFVTETAGGFAVTPIRAYHKLEEDSLNLIIERDGRRLLYACDTGVYQEETWSFLKGTLLHAVVLECTDGFNPSDYWGHLSCDEVIAVTNRLRELACLDEDSKVITSHHAASGMATHAELCDYLEPHGINVGYDGMTFEV